MQVEGLGTVVMFAVAAVLWFAYLVPTWFRRREYLATERNATRLQQTLRIMAETAEVPDAVRAEATARGAAHQERLLRERERQRAARERAAVAAARRAEDRRVAAAERRRARLRRGRLGATLVLLVALVAAGVQGGLALASGSLGSSAAVVLGAAATVGAIAIGALRALARRRIPAPAIASAEPSPVDATPVAAVRRSTREWTPVPVPKPRYLGSPAPQPVVPAADADRLLREASEAAVRALRARHSEAEVVELRSAAPSSAPAAPPVPSRWAAMGVVGSVDAATPDLDEVLRRRRAAG